MPKYTFEIIERGEVKSTPTVLALPNDRALWSCVEALALRAAGLQGASIRVRNSQGDVIIRAGISTALASIEGCKAECPLKNELKHFIACGQHRVPTIDLRQFDCPANKNALAA
jgi:hypothetical protein